MPALKLAETYLSVYFIADLHALTSIRDGVQVRQLTHQVAATWLASGLDPEKTVFFQQSLVPEIPELAWLLDCFCAKGMMNRAHAYKALIDTNKEAGRDLDDGVNMGLFNYPVLMAADILLFGSDVVPVGQDQKQHVEIARDLAEAVNRECGKIFVVPEPLIQEGVKTVPGIDGRKMSKSKDNVIALYEPAAAVKKQVMRIVTDSKKPEEPKDPETCNVFAIFKQFATSERIEARKKQYLAGGVGYAEIKEELAETLEKTFAAKRTVYETWLANPAGLDLLLAKGAERARSLGSQRMDKFRKKLGLRAV